MGFVLYKTTSRVVLNKVESGKMKSVQSEGWGRVSPGPGSGSGSGSGCGQVFSSLTLISTGYWQRPWYSCCCCCGLKYKMGTSFSVGSGSGPVPSLNHLGLGFVGPYRAPNTNSNISFRRVCQEFRPYKNSCSSINASPKPRIFGNAGCLEQLSCTSDKTLQPLS